MVAKNKLNTRMVTLGEALTLSTGKLLCKFNRLHELLEWVVGTPVWTHQFPRILPLASAHVRALFPQLPAKTDEAIASIDEHNWQERLAALQAIHGDVFELRPLAEPITNNFDIATAEVTQMLADKVTEEDAR